jgi:hypothetical protein
MFVGNICLKEWYPQMNEHSHQQLADLRASLESNLTSDRAPSSVRKYTANFAAWLDWAELVGVRAVPAEGTALALFLWDYVIRKKGMTSIYGAVYGVAWAHRLRGLPAPHLHPLMSAGNWSSKTKALESGEKTTPYPSISAAQARSKILVLQKSLYQPYPPYDFSRILCIFEMVRFSQNKIQTHFLFPNTRNYQTTEKKK